MVIGLAIGLPAFHFQSAQWAVGGFVLFGIGLLLVETRQRGNHAAGGDDPGDVADLTDFGSLGDSGDQDSGNSFDN